MWREIRDEMREVFWANPAAWVVFGPLLLALLLGLAFNLYGAFWYYFILTCSQFQANPTG